MLINLDQLLNISFKTAIVNVAICSASDNKKKGGREDNINTIASTIVSPTKVTKNTGAMMDDHVASVSCTSHFTSSRK